MEQNHTYILKSTYTPNKWKTIWPYKQGSQEYLILFNNTYSISTFHLCLIILVCEHFWAGLHTCRKKLARCGNYHSTNTVKQSWWMAKTSCKQQHFSYVLSHQTMLGHTDFFYKAADSFSQLPKEMYSVGSGCSRHVSFRIGCVCVYKGWTILCWALEC